MTIINNFNTILAFINQVEKSNLPFDHSIKIRFLRNFTVEPIESFLKFYLYQSGIKPIISYSDYDGILQEILDPTSYLFTERPDIIVLSVFDGNQTIDTQKDIKNLYDQLLEKTNTLILVNSIIPPFYSFLSSHDTKDSLSAYFYASQNYFIRTYVAQNPSRFILMDWEKYLRIIGEANSIDYRYWYINKAPFKKDFLNYYAKEISRVAKMIKGKSKKCLILDCDNTLWGGIIGEDGIDGIKLHHYEHPGKIFYDFQHFVLTLHEHGTILALCSKNNEEDVWEVLKNHPDCLIKKTHIVAHRINWKDKATNIDELSKELNLGLDSFVFIDDSAVECDLVKNCLPDVTVLQVPEDLYSYPQFLMKEAVFDFLSINEDDAKRGLRYQQENTRRQFEKKFGNIEDYFFALNLSADIHDAKEFEISRIAQLTQKTNQFNLSVKRYTEADIRNLYHSTTTKIFSFTLKDKYGDYGLTGVLIAKRADDCANINSLLLSCRILSRRAEYAFVFYCVGKLYHEWHVNKCTIDFFPTKKNIQVKDFLDTIGSTLKEQKNGMCIYELKGVPKVPMIDFIQIKSENILCENSN